MSKGWWPCFAVFAFSLILLCYLQDGTCEVVIIVQSSDEFSCAPTVSQSLLLRHSNWRNAVIPEGSIMSKFFCSILLSRKEHRKDIEKYVG